MDIKREMSTPVGQIERKDGFSYYVDKDGKVWETKLKRRGRPKKEGQKDGEKQNIRSDTY